MKITHSQVKGMAKEQILEAIVRDEPVDARFYIRSKKETDPDKLATFLLDLSERVEALEPKSMQMGSVLIKEGLIWENADGSLTYKGKTYRLEPKMAIGADSTGTYRWNDLNNFTT